MGVFIKQLGLFIDSLGGVVSKIEAEIGVANGTLAKALKSGKGLSTDTIEKLFKKYDRLNPTWFFKDMGDMWLLEEELPLPAKDDTTIGFDASQQKYLKDLMKTSLEEAQMHYKQDLRDTQKTLELEKEVKLLREQLEKLKSSSK